MSQVDPVLALLIALYAFLVSWLQERFGAFQGLTPSQKQLVNALAGFAVPLVVSVVTGVFGKWPESLGTPDALTLALFALFASTIVWLLTQVAHYVDQILARLAGKPRLIYTAGPLWTEPPHPPI